MTELREVFEVSTKQMEPDQDSWREQQRRQRRKGQVRKIGALGVAAALVVVAIIVIMSNAGPDGTQGVATQPPPQPTTGHQFLDLRTGETTPLPESIAGGFAYMRSPDGTRFAYAPWPDPIGDDVDLEIYVSGIDGTDRRRVNTGGDLDAIFPRWSPDGRSLVYQRRDATGEELGSLAVVDVDTGASTILEGSEQTSSHWFMSPSFGPNNEIVFNLPRGAMDYLPHGKGWDLWTTSEEWASIGGGASLLRKNAAHGSFSPDGATIVYLDRPRIQGDGTFGAGSIWLMDADGGDPRLLVEGDAMAWPRWSPDGTRIAYEDRGRIYVVDVATGDADALAAGGAPEWFDNDTLIISPA